MTPKPAVASAATDDGQVAYLGCLEAQEALYWEARRRGWPLDDKAVGDILRLVAPLLRRSYSTAATRSDLRLPTDWTVAVTVGKWGGFYARGHRKFWRVCLGWVAITFTRDEFLSMVRAYLDREEGRRG